MMAAFKKQVDNEDLHFWERERFEKMMK